MTIVPFALRGAIAFGVAGVFFVVLGKTVGFIPGFPQSEIMGFPLAGIIAGALLASGARSLSAILLAAVGFALGFGVSGGLLFGVMFALGVANASALVVAVVSAIAWAIGGALAGLFLGPIIVPRGVGPRTLAALALTAGSAFAVAGFIGGFVAWASLSVLGADALWLGFALTMLAGGTLTGSALGRLARGLVREAHEPERPDVPPPARISGLAALGAILGLLGVTIAVLSRLRLPIGPAKTSAGGALFFAALGVPALLLGLRVLAEIRKSGNTLLGRIPAAAAIAAGVLLTILAGALLIGPLGRRIEAEYQSTTLQRAREAGKPGGAAIPGGVVDAKTIHGSNIALGRIALKEGNVEAAKRYLLEAGKAPGSPALDTFGPDLTLAADLLARGERDAILEYLELCANFWGSGQGRLGYWIAELKNGGTPNFKAPVEALGPTPSAGSADLPRVLMPPAYEMNSERIGPEDNYIETVASGSESDPEAPIKCQLHCAQNPECRAWTYIQPNTIKGPHGRCRLEREARPSRTNTCCVSGVRRSESEAAETAGLRIKSVRLVSVYNGGSGRCPKESSANANVAYQGESSRVVYRFLYSDGYVWRTRTTAFPRGEGKALGISRIHGKSFSGWLVFQILEPYHYESDPAILLIGCR
jgi:hypothetical protein